MMTRVGSPFCTLQAAVNAADIGDSIRLLPGVYSESVSINQSITIHGGGSDVTIIDGTNTSTVITIATEKSVYISDMAIANGSSVSQGGGIVNMGILTIENCDINNNKARGVNTLTSNDGTARSAKGGGIYNEGRITINDCVIRNNRAIGSKGGFVGCNQKTFFGSPPTTALGGAIYNIGFVALNNCTIRSNSATGGRGVGTSAEIGKGGSNL